MYSTTTAKNARNFDIYKITEDFTSSKDHTINLFYFGFMAYQSLKVI